MDIEETEPLQSKAVVSDNKIKIFYKIPIVFPSTYEVTLFNWKKFMIALWGIQSMFFLSLCGLIKPDWSPVVKCCVFTAIITPFLGYFMVLLNMFNGGWGREESQFWCHMRVMYLAGYNYMRWTIAAIVDPSIVIATCFIQGENSHSTLWAGVSIVYCYYMLASLEKEKSKPIEWEKFKDDFDVKLQLVHENQLKNTIGASINPIVLCVVLTIIPWVTSGWKIGYFIMVYQLIMCINTFRYVSSVQTFVITDTQFDIIQFIFRLGITWTFIWIC